MGRGIMGWMLGLVVLMLGLVVDVRVALATTRYVKLFPELKAAIVASTVDTIVVMHNMEFKGEIVVNRTVAVQGNTDARVVLDAANTNRHFLVGLGGDVVFSNLHFTNVYSAGLTVVSQCLTTPPPPMFSNYLLQSVFPQCITPPPPPDELCISSPKHGRTLGSTVRISKRAQTKAQSLLSLPSRCCNAGTNVHCGAQHNCPADVKTITCILDTIDG
jgi:hypothetical protein